MFSSSSDKLQTIDSPLRLGGTSIQELSKPSKVDRLTCCSAMVSNLLRFFSKTPSISNLILLALAAEKMCITFLWPLSWWSSMISAEQDGLNASTLLILSERLIPPLLLVLTAFLLTILAICFLTQWQMPVFISALVITNESPQCLLSLGLHNKPLRVG